MTLIEAKEILIEMQKWKRGEGVYSTDFEGLGYNNNYPKPIPMPYTSSEFGKAIDIAIDRLETEIGLHGNFECKI